MAFELGLLFKRHKLYCLVTEAHRCEQLAQGCYAAFAPSIGIEPTTYWSQVQRSTRCHVVPPRHLIVSSRLLYNSSLLSDSLVTTGRITPCCAVELKMNGKLSFHCPIFRRRSFSYNQFYIRRRTFSHHGSLHLRNTKCQSRLHDTIRYDTINYHHVTHWR